MKKVLLYYNFSYPLGGGDFLPLTFASWLQSRCELTLAVDSESGFRRALEAFGVPLDTGRIKVAPLLPNGLDFRSHNAFWSFVRSVRLKRLAAKADICISAANVTDFGRPAHHFINMLSGVDHAFAAHGGIVMPRASLKRFIADGVVRPLAGMRSKRRIFADERERFYSNSKYVHDRLTAFYGSFHDTIFYPPTTYEPDVSVEAPPRDPMRVICLGRINPQKRVADVIDIVERARARSGKDIRLTVAGPCGNGEYATQIRLAAGERPWITLVDGVFGRAKDDLLRSGRFAVHARRDEEFGIAVTEYLKAGLIPVVPDEGGSREVVGRPELSYSTNDEAASKLARLVTDNAFAETMLGHCRSRAAAFSRGEYERREADLLEKILSEPSRQPARE